MTQSPQSQDADPVEHLMNLARNFAEASVNYAFQMGESPVEEIDALEEAIRAALAAPQEAPAKRPPFGPRPIFELASHPPSAQKPSEVARWIAEAKGTLDRLSRFLQHIGAPHAVDWREWIDNAEKHLEEHGYNEDEVAEIEARAFDRGRAAKPAAQKPTPTFNEWWNHFKESGKDRVWSMQAACWEAFIASNPPSTERAEPERLTDTQAHTALGARGYREAFDAGRRAALQEAPAAIATAPPRHVWVQDGQVCAEPAPAASAEPEIYVQWTEDYKFIRFWTRDKKQAELQGGKLVPLYAAPTAALASPVNAAAPEAASEELICTLLSELAGVDTFDTNLRDHPKAWEAVTSFLNCITAMIIDAQSNHIHPPAASEPAGWREALQFYADGNHFTRHVDDAWETVSGEPANFYEDESNTATVEDGTVAAMALKGTPIPDDEPAASEREGEHTPIGPGCPSLE